VEGFETAAVDYRGVDDPDERVQLLHEFSPGFPPPGAGEAEPRRLRSLAAAPTLHARRVPDGAGDPCLAFRSSSAALPTVDRADHGWRDEVVLRAEHAFCEENRLSLHLVESDHRLHSALHFIRFLFQYFLIESRRAQYVDD
jgi:hypothetical protein